ncbi:MAG: glycosyltransferase, partial [Clostridiales bacterium]|nr:glycosyltransferase [Clostridiales bacterium]
MTNTTLEKNFISAVVYVHENEKDIKNFLTMLYGELVQHYGKFEIIMVDDASTDQSLEAIREVASSFEQSVVSILKMSYYQGLELAMNAGKRLAIGDYVFEFDTTNQDYNPEMIYNVYKEALTGYDIVSASSNQKPRFTSEIFYKVFNAFSKVQYKLTTENFRVLSRRAINRIDASSTTILYRKAVYANCGLKCKNIVYSASKRAEKSFTGQQKQYRQELATESLILHTNIAYKVSSILTFLMMAVALFSLIYTIVVFVTGNPVAGWTTMMLVLSFGFLGMFAILSIVIRYLT